MAVLKDEVGYFEERPWGNYTVLYKGDNFQLKHLTIYPGKRLSYQSHQHRKELWVVASGVATVIKNDISHTLSQSERIIIEKQDKHRLGNDSNDVLHVIETQFGDYFGEDDIVRYTDDFGRV